MYATANTPEPGAALVIVGAVGPAVMLMLNDCVDTGRIPFEAVTVPLKAPTTVGVPEITPAVLRLRPVGSTPAVTAKVIVAVPVAA